MKKRIKGFTLIELLATVIILSIVLLIAVPVILNTIENTRKKAFINSVLAFSASTSKYLDTEAIENGFTYPNDDEFILFDISNLSLDNGDKYLGEIAVLKNENDKTIHLPYITDEKYYVCGVATEILTTKHIQTEECNMPEEGESITIIDGIDINNSIDTDGDGFPDIIEEEYNTNPNDNTSYPDPNNTVDTDGDGYSDALEEKYNTDPNDNTSYPSNDVNKEPSIIDYYLKPFDLVKIRVNKPILAAGMTPIKWDIYGQLTETTENDKSWYDYSASGKRWANAMTEDGSMWVWIPRYAYQINSGTLDGIPYGNHASNAGTIGIKYLKGITNKTFNGSSTLPVDQGNKPGYDGNYVTHPAFKFGDDELEGIWVAKFESSLSEGNVASVPNVATNNLLTIGTMFDYSRNMETMDIYGWGTTGNGIDTHMIKDVEWGAAAYLSWSNYGKNSEIWINSSWPKNSITSGCAGASVSAPPNMSIPGCINAYNTYIGQNASTTGNYYGIYDMSGGMSEYTASYLSGGNSFLAEYGSSLISSDKKYVDVYLGNSNDEILNASLNTKYYGNAMYETSYADDGKAIGSWNSDYSLFPYYSYPFSVRGGSATDTIAAGAFAYNRYMGSAGMSWRTTLIVKEGL